MLYNNCCAKPALVVDRRDEDNWPRVRCTSCGTWIKPPPSPRLEAAEELIAVIEGYSDEYWDVHGVSNVTRALFEINNHELTRKFQAWASEPKRFVNNRRIRAESLLTYLRSLRNGDHQ